MNTEEVMAMIDAIAEGRRTKIGWEGSDLSDNLKLDVEPSAIGFSICSELFEVDDPRVAREIAGALVAWANRKEGVGTAAETLEALQKVMSETSENRQGVWREDWYRRNVQRMDLVTLKRNKADMQNIRETLSRESPEWEDITKAINLVNDELYKRDQSV